MSDHEPSANEEAQRAERRAALRQIAWEETGEFPQPLPVAAVDAESACATPPAARTAERHTARRVALIALTACIVLASVGAFAIVRVHQATRVVRTNRTATPAVPACDKSAPSSASAASATGSPAFPPANIRVSNDSYLAHSEPMVAVNPANPLNLVGGSKFFTDPAHYRFQIGTYASFDGGCAWQDNGVLPGFAPSETTSDVSIAFGPANRVYAAVLYTDNAKDSGIAVATSTDGGKTFGAPVHVYDDPTGAIFSDKPWIAVDMSKSRYRGNIYVVWSYDGGGSCGDDNACNQELGFVRSTDGGKSFSAARQVEGQAPFCTNPAKGRAANSQSCDGVLGAIPVVLPDGVLAVAYDYIDVSSSGRIPTRLVVVTSPDGGLTWATPVLIATISDISGVFPPDRYRVASLPAFAADPAHGMLAIAWADNHTGDSDILFESSGDDGITWSAPVRVNDDPLRDGANQFQPQLAYAPNGVLTVSFFDTRRDPHHHLIDVYLAQSLIGGAIFLSAKAFLPNVRVTTQNWDPTVDAPVDSSGLQFIGDYQGLAATNQFVYPFWNDTRTGSQQIFTALAPSVQP